MYTLQAVVFDTFSSFYSHLQVVGIHETNFSFAPPITSSLPVCSVYDHRAAPFIGL